MAFDQGSLGFDNADKCHKYKLTGVQYVPSVRGKGTDCFTSSRGMLTSRNPSPVQNELIPGYLDSLRDLIETVPLKKTLR